MRQALLTGLALALIGCGTPTDKITSDFDLDSFASGEVTKHVHPGSKYLLVHLKGPHKVAPYDNDYGTSEAEEWDSYIKPLKQEEGLVAEEIIDTYSLDGVYDEGHFVKDGDNQRFTQEELCDPRVITEVRRSDREGLNELFYECGSAPTLKYLFPSETIEARKISTEARENVLLELVAQRDNPLALTTYGSGHSWVNNVEEWNEQNPDKKFSLIEVTTNSYNHGEVVAKSESLFGR